MKELNKSDENKHFHMTDTMINRRWFVRDIYKDQPKKNDSIMIVLRQNLGILLTLEGNIRSAALYVHSNTDPVALIINSEKGYYED